MVLITLHRASGDADGRAEDHQGQAEQHREAIAIDHAGGDIARLVVGAQPVLPIRRCGRGAREIEHGGIVAIRNGRPDHPALGLDQADHVTVLEVGRRLEIAAEGGLRIVEQNRRIEMPVVAHQERTIVGDEFGEQACDEKREEEPHRPVAAPVGAKGGQPAPVERR